MLLVYVNDIVCVSFDPMTTMKSIESTFKLKDDKIEPPDLYLGALLQEKVVDGIKCWTMLSQKYVRSAIKNVEEVLGKRGEKLPTKCLIPITSNYRLQANISTGLSAEGVTYYQELIGILQWAYELGRVNILAEVSFLSQHLALPQEGHLNQVFHTFDYLKRNSKRTIAFDPRHPDISENRFVEHDWYDFYWDAVEPVPEDLPRPRGNMLSTHCFIDTDHASNKVTRHNHTE